MPSIVVEVSEEIADRWAHLAGLQSIPVETWLGLCGFWGSALELPMTRIVLRRPPALRCRLGVAWEIGQFPQLTLPRRSQKAETPMINKVILLGHVGRTPVVHTAPAGTPVAGFSLATTRQWRRPDGTLRERTEWHAIVCYGRYAEIAGEHLTCGRQLYVEGRIRTRSWEDRHSGQTRYSTEIICERFQMLGVGRTRTASGSQGLGRNAESDPPESESEPGSVPSEPESDTSEPGPGARGPRPLSECKSMSQLATTIIVQ